ncbi:hypothetical protein [Bradyrhizobium prioriisuperbiae]|uniref:hypothetical protein n=1 Tax=Bradyrhizobium prioriisuperbiae TaxID=2854389 RepID=UPI0028E430E1|nr:hypothetical protein [Bradyrhizobium prioritasuperba]
MSRSGYSDDCDQWQLIRYRGAVASAFRGKRGQSFLKETLAALDALPVKRLVANELAAPDLISCSHWGIHEGESVCAIGAVGRSRGIDMAKLDPEDAEAVAGTFGIAEAMAREIVYENDEYSRSETPEARYARVRAWVVGQIIPTTARGTER